MRNSRGSVAGAGETMKTLITLLLGIPGTITLALLALSWLPLPIISRAATPGQRIFRTTVADLHRAPKLAPPTLLVVGEVVRFAERNLVEDSAASVLEHELGAELATRAPILAKDLRTDEELFA